MADSAAPAPPPFANPFANPKLLADPYPLYAMLRSNNPVFRAPIPGHDGPGVWLLTRHADCHAVLRDPRFSVRRELAAITQQYRDQLPQALLGGPDGLRTMLIMDPPDHTRVRRLVNKAFTPRRVAGLGPRIEALVEGLLDEAESRGRFDLIHDLAEPLPAVVIAELLGVPARDHRQFRAWSKALIGILGQGPGDAAARIEQALNPLLDYLRGVIAERRRDLRDDLISDMIQAQEEREALSDPELLSTSFLLLLAGYETTTNLIGNGTLALLRNREQWDRLRREPTRLDAAIEELLRFDSPVQATVRVALEDVALAGSTLPAGALVVTVIGAANRDPAVFDEPDRLDIARDAARQHLSFGFGTHFCLGAPLARLEARHAFAGLLTRFPKLRLDGDAVVHRPSPVLRGLEALPVYV